MREQNKIILKGSGKGRRPDSDSIRLAKRVRTIATLKWAMQKKSFENPHQFSRWFDAEMQRLDPEGKDTQTTGKWRKNIEGGISLGEKYFKCLNNLIPEFEGYFLHGPENLWDALWGDEIRLWELCTIRATQFPGKFKNDGIRWPVSLVGPDLPFAASLHNFECGLLAKYKNQCGELEMRDFVRAICLFRLHKNSVHRRYGCGIGAYRCVKLCLWSPSVSNFLERFGIYECIASEFLLFDEHDLIKSDDVYREKIAKAIHGNESHRVFEILYAVDPFELYSVDRWMADFGIN